MVVGSVFDRFNDVLGVVCHVLVGDDGRVNRVALDRCTLYVVEVLGGIPIRLGDFAGHLVDQGACLKVKLVVDAGRSWIVSADNHVVDGAVDVVLQCLRRSAFRVDGTALAWVDRMTLLDIVLRGDRHEGVFQSDDVALIHLVIVVKDDVLAFG